MHTSEGMRPGRTPQMGFPFHAVVRDQDRTPEGNGGLELPLLLLLFRDLVEKGEPGGCLAVTGGAVIAAGGEGSA